MLELRGELSRRGSSALEDFWRGVVAEGTPLVEPKPDDDTCLVTFLWRGEAERIFVIGSGGFQSVKENQLLRLADTDLFHRTYRVPRSLRTTYRFLLDAPPIDQYTADAESREQLFAYLRRPDIYRRDELNPHAVEGETFFLGGRSCLVLPDAPAQPFVDERPESPAQVETHPLESRILGNSRMVTLTHPAGLGDAVNCVVVFDGEVYTRDIPGPTILRNLALDGIVAPTLGVFVHNVSLATRVTELLCSDKFSDFVGQELIPWLGRRAVVPENPQRWLVAGSSAGGVAAAQVALRLPQIFGKVLSQSGTFGSCRAHSLLSQKSDEWLTEQYRTSTHLGLDFYVEVGEFESNPFADPLGANRRFVEVLRQRRYRVDYDEYCGGHDYLHWRGSFATGLGALLGPGPRG